MTYRITSEAELQASIVLLLTRDEWCFERERILTPSERIDFLVEGRIGIEVKIKRSPSALHRQLLRYAETSTIEALLVVVTKPLLLDIPDVLHAKPVRAVFLSGAVF